MQQDTRTKRTFAILSLCLVVALSVACGRGNANATPEAVSPRATADRPLRTPQPERSFGPGVGFHSARQLSEHFEKHGNEFGARTTHEYLARAQRLRDAPAGGDILEVVRGDGVITRFDRGSGAFIAFNPDGTIRTFFKPNLGEDYFRRQANEGRRRE